MPDKPPKPPSTCHPELPTLARGLCRACYSKDRRARLAAERAAWRPEPTDAELRTDAELSRPLMALLERPRDLAHAVQIAHGELIEALPEAARALRRILATGDPDKDTVLKAAVAVLRGVSVEGAQGLNGLKRLLDVGPKPTEAPQRAQVVIGLHIAAGGDVQAGRVVGTIAPTGGKR